MEAAAGGYRFVSIVDVQGGGEEWREGVSSDTEGADSIESGVCLEEAACGGVTVIRLTQGTSTPPHHSTEILQFLISEKAEARLAAKRQARAEAREIRMRELARQQKEEDENADRLYDIYSTPDGVGRVGRNSLNSSRLSASNSYQSSRRSSEDSLEETTSLRDVRSELREVEDKFRKAMIGNAQLDNEKASASYQVELYKDKFEELEESYAQLQREHKEKCRLLEQTKREAAKHQSDLSVTLAALEERDRLILEQGLVIVGGEESSSGADTDEGEEPNDEGGGIQSKRKRALVSTQMAALLESVGTGSLDVRLKRLATERNELIDELRHVKLELEEERAKATRLGFNPDDLEEIQRETNKQLAEYKFKLQKADQDVSTLSASVARLESQVLRYKTAAEEAEQLEDELKTDKRKLQRELRESQARVEELETAQTHLQRRLDKLKNAKSALLKDL